MMGNLFISHWIKHLFIYLVMLDFFGILTIRASFNTANHSTYEQPYRESYDNNASDTQLNYSHRSLRPAPRVEIREIKDFSSISQPRRRAKLSPLSLQLYQQRLKEKQTKELIQLTNNSKASSFVQDSAVSESSHTAESSTIQTQKHVHFVGHPPEYNNSYREILSVKYPNIHSTTFRVAILVIYTGEFWPIWFNTFLFTAQYAQDLYDWIFILPKEFSPSPIQLPKNVKLYYLSFDELCDRLLSIDDRFSAMQASEKKDMILRMKHLLVHQPYVLVEFKPCLGDIFQDILQSYSHWAYADIDTLLGRINKIIDRTMLNSYDIVTTSFGDIYVVYMRGQLTIHKNQPDINKIYQVCNHFLNITNRLRSFEFGAQKWPFQSAEGCYSYAVIRKSNASVLIVTSQYSDAYYARLEIKESFMIGKSVMQCYRKPIHIESDSRKRDHTKSLQNFLLQDIYIEDHRKNHMSLVMNINETKLNLKRYKCVALYWFDPKYEVIFMQLHSLCRCILCTN